MTIPRVVLIGGAPCVGKSAVSRCVASRYEYGCISIDDIGKAVGAVCPEIRTMNDMSWQEYFATTSVEVLLEHAANSRKRLWPAVEKIVRTHSDWDNPLVMEGYTLWPEQVIAARFTATGAVWLSCDDLLLESRIRTQPDFYKGAVDEEALVSNFLLRSSRYNELMLKSAAECNAVVITVNSGHTIKDVADLCVSALTTEAIGTGNDLSTSI